MQNRDETPREWVEARALLVHRLSEIESKTRELDEKIAKQNDTIMELKLKLGTIAAVVATAISLVSWLLTHFGISIGRK